MNVENIQQGHIYNERIQEFFPLFDKAKKEDDPIYNARVGFNTVKFLIEHPDWNEDKNKNKAYEFILQECDKTKKARQKLESEVQKRLKDYIEGGVKEDGVKIYGNHASITLEDNKKEFKISEFLNSDFCQKNGISGFSTLHSDGKSGMHGFIAEEGGRKIRHYTVTDGSYEMTLNWYVNGEKCTIKINIDKDGVDLIERNGVTDTQLQANKDVKIGGLFLHQIQFREKGKENKMQKDSQSSETVIGNSKNVIQNVTEPTKNDKATDTTQDVWSHIPPLPPFRNDSFKRNIFGKQEGLDHQDDGQNEFSSNVTDIAQKRFTENVLEKIKKEKPIYKWLKDKVEGKENNQNLDFLEEKLSKKYSQGNNDDSKPLSPTSTGGNEDMERLIYKKMLENIEAFQANPYGHFSSGSKSDFSSPIATDHSQPQVDPEHLTGKFAEEKPNQHKEGIALKEHGKNSQDRNDTVLSEPAGKESKGVSSNSTKSTSQDGEQNELSSNATDIAQKRFTENVLEKIKKEKPIYKWLKDKVGGKENNQNLDFLEEKLSKKCSQGNNDDSKPLSPTSTGGNTDVEQSSNTQPQKNSRRNGKEPEEEERNFQKISEALESWKEKRRNAEQSDSNPSSPTQDSNGQSQVDPKQLKKSLMNAGQSNDTLLTEFTSKLDRETQKFPLRQVDQKEISKQTRERLLADGLLKDNSTDVKKMAERENTDTNLTIDKNSNLHRLLEKDVAQLKAGVIEEEREDTLVEHTNSHDRNRIALANRNRKLLWTEHVAKQQAKETKDILR